MKILLIVILAVLIVTLLICYERKCRRRSRRESITDEGYEPTTDESLLTGSSRRNPSKAKDLTLDIDEREKYSKLQKPNINSVEAQRQKEEIEKLLLENADLKNNNRAISAENKKIRLMVSNEIEVRERQIDERDEHIRQLENGLQVGDKRITELEKFIQILKSSNSEKEDEIQSQGKMIKTLKHKIDIREKDIRILNTAIAIYQKKGENHFNMENHLNSSQKIERLKAATIEKNFPEQRNNIRGEQIQKDLEDESEMKRSMLKSLKDDSVGVKRTVETFREVGSARVTQTRPRGTTPRSLPIHIVEPPKEIANLHDIFLKSISFLERVRSCTVLFRAGEGGE